MPPTVILPHKHFPGETTERSMRNLEYPLNWDAVFAYVGEHGFLKPVDGGGWRDVHEVHNREEFFRAYDESRDLCMMYQKAVNFKEYFRCYVVGQKKVRIMPYDPRRPHAERYMQDPPRSSKGLLYRSGTGRTETMPRAWLRPEHGGVRCEDGIPYAIDFMNPVPDADLNSVGAANFDWISAGSGGFGDSQERRPRRAFPNCAGRRFLGRIWVRQKPQERILHPREQ